MNAAVEMPDVSRRRFLGGTAAAGLGFAFAGHGSLEAFARPAPRPPAPVDGYGPLIPDPLNRVALPEGFSYRVVAQSGVTPTRNGLFPSDPDGMALFRRRGGGSALVCNHEIATTERFPVPEVSGLTYDKGARGGTSTIEVDEDGGLIDAYTSVAGTDNNCAGGVTPWGTWLTCEETERVAGEEPVAGRPLEEDHGFVFEVDPRSQRANLGRSPIPLTFLGRYSHEAVAVDPVRHTIYLTEDAATPNGLYYRWKPPRRFRGGRGALHELAQSPHGATAGRLQAMCCFDGDRQVPDLAEATDVGTWYRVRWVDVPDRLATADSVREQFGNDQITRSRKLEGQWWGAEISGRYGVGRDGAYFVSSFARTTDGSVKQHDGQVWFYDPRRKRVTLKTIFGVDADQSNPDGPDNITVSPHGGLILAEDGGGTKFLVGVSERGTAYPLARNDIRNAAGNFVNGEFAGPTFSKDGQVLFCNIYTGFVLAITGPWRPHHRSGAAGPGGPVQ